MLAIRERGLWVHGHCACAQPPARVCLPCLFQDVRCPLLTRCPAAAVASCSSCRHVWGPQPHSTRLFQNVGCRQPPADQVLSSSCGLVQHVAAVRKHGGLVGRPPSWEAVCGVRRLGQMRGRESGGVAGVDECWKVWCWARVVPGCLRADPLLTLHELLPLWLVCHDLLAHGSHLTSLPSASLPQALTQAQHRAAGAAL